MSDGDYYVILDTSISNNKSIRMILKRHDCNIIKLLRVSFEVVITIFVIRIKKEMTRKDVDNT